MQNIQATALLMSCMLILLGDDIKQKYIESPCIRLICNETSDISLTKSSLCILECANVPACFKGLSSGEADALTFHWRLSQLEYRIGACTK